MGDSDLEAIRQARLQQLCAQNSQQQQRGNGSAGKDNDQQQKEAAARENILSQILSPEAADRLGRIRLVKESRATDVENRLIFLAKSGQLRQQVTEPILIDILNSMNEQEAKQAPQTMVTRRKGWDDDDNDDELFRDL